MAVRSIFQDGKMYRFPPIANAEDGDVISYEATSGTLVWGTGGGDANVQTGGFVFGFGDPEQWAPVGGFDIGYQLIKTGQYTGQIWLYPHSDCQSGKIQNTNPAGQELFMTGTIAGAATFLGIGEEFSSTNLNYLCQIPMQYITGTIPTELYEYEFYLNVYVSVAANGLDLTLTGIAQKYPEATGGAIVRNGISVPFVGNTAAAGVYLLGVQRKPAQLVYPFYEVMGYLGGSICWVPKEPNWTLGVQPNV
jgi:hypothetical protein